LPVWLGPHLPMCCLSLSRAYFPSRERDVHFARSTYFNVRLPQDSKALPLESIVSVPHLPYTTTACQKCVGCWATGCWRRRSPRLLIGNKSKGPLRLYMPGQAKALRVLRARLTTCLQSFTT